MNIEKLEAVSGMFPLVEMMNMLVSTVMANKSKRYLYLQDMDSPTEMNNKLLRQVEGAIEARRLEEVHGINCGSTYVAPSSQQRRPFTLETSTAFLALHSNLTVVTAPSGLISKQLIEDQFRFAKYDHIFIATTSGIIIPNDFCQDKEGSVTYVNNLVVDETYAIRDEYDFNPTWVARPEDLA